MLRAPGARGRGCGRFARSRGRAGESGSRRPRAVQQAAAAGERGGQRTRRKRRGSRFPRRRRRGDAGRGEGGLRARAVARRGLGGEAGGTRRRGWEAGREPERGGELGGGIRAPLGSPGHGRRRSGAANHCLARPAERGREPGAAALTALPASRPHAPPQVSGAAGPSRSYAPGAQRGGAPAPWARQPRLRVPRGLRRRRRRRPCLFFFNQIVAFLTVECSKFFAHLG